jgi:hypothetical protein
MLHREGNNNKVKGKTRRSRRKRAKGGINRARLVGLIYQAKGKT